MTKSAVAAHTMIADLAIQYAHECYEASAGSNAFYELLPNREDYVREVAPTLVKQVRMDLAKLLADPEIPDSRKAEIHEALVLDNAIPHSKQRGVFERRIKT